jgi:hypothetical protein
MTTNLTAKFLPTQNPGWGFYGTLTTAGLTPQHVDAAWNCASLMIQRETGAEREAIRAFLDSAHGRHFADDVWCAMSRAGQTMRTGITSTCDRWMGWRIGRSTSGLHGIPAGLPYLTGWVEHEGIIAEREGGGR